MSRTTSHSSPRIRRYSYALTGPNHTADTAGFVVGCAVRDRDVGGSVAVELADGQPAGGPGQVECRGRFRLAVTVRQQGDQGEIPCTRHDQIGAAVTVEVSQSEGPGLLAHEDLADLQVPAHRFLG